MPPVWLADCSVCPMSWYVAWLLGRHAWRKLVNMVIHEAIFGGVSPLAGVFGWLVSLIIYPENLVPKVPAQLVRWIKAIAKLPECRLDVVSVQDPSHFDVQSVLSFNQSYLICG